MFNFDVYGEDSYYMNSCALHGDAGDTWYTVFFFADGSAIAVVYPNV